MVTLNKKESWSDYNYRQNILQKMLSGIRSGHAYDKGVNYLPKDNNP